MLYSGLEQERKTKVRHRETRGQKLREDMVRRGEEKLGKDKMGEELRKKSMSSAAERPRGESVSKGYRMGPTWSFFPRAGSGVRFQGQGARVRQWEEQGFRIRQICFRSWFCPLPGTYSLVASSSAVK